MPARGLILEFKSPIICHRCGKEGHIRPNFPEAEAAVVKKHQKEFLADDKIKLCRVIVNQYDLNELLTVVLRVGLETPSVDMRISGCHCLRAKDSSSMTSWQNQSVGLIEPLDFLCIWSSACLQK